MLVRISTWYSRLALCHNKCKGKQEMMNINQRTIIVLSLILSACTEQSFPVTSTLEENRPASVPSATSTSQTSSLSSATPQSSPEPTPTVEEIIPITAPTPNSVIEIIPVTAPEIAPQPTNNSKPDKFQEFKIPVKGEGGGSMGLLPVTGFPPGEVTGIRSDIPLLSNLFNPTLVIPSLDVNIPIFGIELRNGTWDVSWLWDQAGWLEGSAYPTSNGNSVLTAHVVTADGKDGPFAHLRFLTNDDYIFIVNSGYRYIYKVDSISYVKPDDLSVVSQEENPWLTLITCASYDEETNEYLLRVVVRAQLIEVKEIMVE